MHARQKVVGAFDAFLRLTPQDLWRILTASRQAGLGIPRERHHVAGRKRLLQLGSVIPDRDGRSPEALQKLVASEVARWTPVLKAAGATAN